MNLNQTEQYLLDLILAQNRRDAEERIARFLAAVAADRDIPLDFLRVDADRGEILDLRAEVVAPDGAAGPTGPLP